MNSTIERLVLLLIRRFAGDRFGQPSTLRAKGRFGQSPLHAASAIAGGRFGQSARPRFGQTSHATEESASGSTDVSAYIYIHNYIFIYVYIYTFNMSVYTYAYTCVYIHLHMCMAS